MQSELKEEVRQYIADEIIPIIDARIRVVRPERPQSTIAHNDKSSELLERIIRVEEEIKHLRHDFLTLTKNMDKRFESVDKRFESVDKRFEELIHYVDKRFEDLIHHTDKRFESIEKRFSIVYRLISLLGLLTAGGFGTLITLLVRL